MTGTMLGLSPYRQHGAAMDDSPRPAGEVFRLRLFADALWGPIPWMLELMIVLLLALGDYAGMSTVAVLLGVNLACAVAWDRPLGRAASGSRAGERPQAD